MKNNFFLFKKKIKSKFAICNKNFFCKMKVVYFYNNKPHKNNNFFNKPFYIISFY